MISAAQATVVSKILGSEAFLEILKMTQQELFSDWCGETDQSDRERIYNEMRGIESVWDMITSLAHEIEHESGDTNP